jgi:hypothetical protein
MKRGFKRHASNVLNGFFLCMAIAAVSMGASTAKSFKNHGLATSDSGPPPTPEASNSQASEEMPDRLAIPVLPDNPTQVELGSDVYYYNCMPCHGDRGQGLTDEFRQLWVEDHQNCWGRGCHGGRVDDPGFPLPKKIPAVSHLPGALMEFPTPEDLYTFLHTSHPPQRPGALETSEYWEVTAFLLEENGRLPSDGQVGPMSRHNLSDSLLAMGGLLTATLVVASAMIWQAKKYQI